MAVVATSRSSKQVQGHGQVPTQPPPTHPPPPSPPFVGVSPGWVFQIRSESKIFYTGHEARPVETLRVRGTRAPTLFCAADKFALATLNLEEAPAGYQIAYPCNNGASELEQSV